MVTSVPARILRLSQRELAKDWIAVRTRAQTPEGALFGGAVALVVVAGRIRLISPELAAQFPAAERRRFQLLRVENRPPVLVDADVRACAALPRSISAVISGSPANGFSRERHVGPHAHPGDGTSQPVQLPLRDVRHLEAHRCARDLRGGTHPHVDDLDGLGVQHIVFTGGEPLMHSDLFRLAAPLRARGMRTTLLSTGPLLARDAAAHRGIHGRRDRLA